MPLKVYRMNYDGTNERMVADEMLGPLLRAYDDLVAENEQLRRDVQKLIRRS